MNKHKMKGIRGILHELVTVKQRTAIAIYAAGRCFITISGARYLTVSRGKHRGLPGRGMCTPLHMRDDSHFELFSTPLSVLSYDSKSFTKELLETLSEVRPKLGQVYKEKIVEGATTLPKDFFKIDPPIHELGLRCMEVAGMLPKGGLAASKEDFDAFFENKPVEMLNDPAKE